MTKKCDNPNCNRDIPADEVGSGGRYVYCSELCKTDDYIHKAHREWTTMSIRKPIRDRLKKVRDDIHSKEHKDIGYSDVIRLMLNMFERIIFTPDIPESEQKTIGDFIISNFDELV